MEETVKRPVLLVSRKMAFRILRRFERRVECHYRNYELESLLNRYIGHSWVIGEHCPRNGKYCGWGSMLFPDEIGIRTKRQRATQWVGNPAEDSLRGLEKR
jgi:hypothetical protein